MCIRDSINPPQCGILAVGGGRSVFSKYALCDLCVSVHCVTSQAFLLSKLYNIKLKVLYKFVKNKVLLSSF